jgi:hypothetical protein
VRVPGSHVVVKHVVDHICLQQRPKARRGFFASFLGGPTLEPGIQHPPLCVCGVANAGGITVARLLAQRRWKLECFCEGEHIFNPSALIVHRSLRLDMRARHTLSTARRVQAGGLRAHRGIRSREPLEIVRVIYTNIVSGIEVSHLKDQISR